MKLSQPNTRSATSAGICENHDSLIWLPCANSAARLRSRTGRMSMFVLIRRSDSSILRSSSGLRLSASGISTPSSRSASHSCCHSLRRIAIW
jgi:hypothetical protein